MTDFADVANPYDPDKIGPQMFSAALQKHHVIPQDIFSSTGKPEFAEAGAMSKRSWQQKE